MRWILTAWFVLFAVFALGCPGIGGPFEVPGTGVLPACSDAPDGDLTGPWFDDGELTILTDGCAGAMVGETLSVCALDWQMSQSGNDVSITVDDEYAIDGRLCGDQLHLKGGWWLPTEDPPFGCTYEDDTAEEVGIQAEGNVLTLAEDETMSGTLVVRGSCTAEYAVTFSPRRF